MRRIVFIFTILSLLSLLVYAQETRFNNEPTPGWNIEQGIELPIGKTDWEIQNEHLFRNFNNLTDDPPPQPAVNPAEWERMTGVLIRYPLGISYSLISEMSEDVIVCTVVWPSSQQQTVTNLYQQNGVNMANTDWLVAQNNSYWSRDYGPWFIFNGNNVQGITDHHYNRPTRPYDDLIPQRYGEAKNIPFYYLSLIHTGGNYMSDGMGISMSSELVYDENPTLTEAQVDSMMHIFCGVEDYDVRPDILTGGIHHIDCWAKLIDPGRIIAKRLNPPNAVLEANVAYWESKISSYGRPYEVIRVDCASSTPYTNSLILNDKVLVPIFNNALDQQALNTYMNAMPGYEILGFTGSWVSDDAIHCRTMGITDRYMLRITHIPLFDRENNGQPYQVTANIHAYSNTQLLTGQPRVFYRVDGGAYTSVQMTNQGGDVYMGLIPSQPDYSLVEYYIHAEDDSNRVENHPFIGQPGAHKFNILPATSVEVTLTPASLPITIPANGGSFSYGLSITNACNEPVSFDAWLKAQLPNGNTTQINMRLGLTLAPGATLTRQMNQNVPASAPAGNYLFICDAGQYPVSIFGEDDFPFSKSASESLGKTVSDWNSEGWGSNFINLAGLPENFELRQNYPNPFNNSTTITFLLPEKSDVTLRVYNSAGQEVETILQGQLSAGEQSITWNAKNLSSGMYFYRLTTPEFDTVKKCVLLK